jgi:CheY-like chemotaxis protein
VTTALLGPGIECAVDNGHRLTFLVIEAEPAQGLSTRKLLLETAKHNVLTSYSPAEGVKMFQRFSAVDVVAVDGSFGDVVCRQLVKSLKENNPDIRVVALMPHVGAYCTWADATINSHDPAGLLNLLEEMGGRADVA